jgi:hypothetical protein
MTRQSRQAVEKRFRGSRCKAKTGRLHANLPNSKMVVLSDVGHAVQEEKPSLLLPYSQQFLDIEAHRPAPGSE